MKKIKTYILLSWFYIKFRIKAILEKSNHIDMYLDLERILLKLKKDNIISYKDANLNLNRFLLAILKYAPNIYLEIAKAYTHQGESLASIYKCIASSEDIDANLRYLSTQLRLFLVNIPLEKTINRVYQKHKKNTDYNTSEYFYKNSNINITSYEVFTTLQSIDESESRKIIGQIPSLDGGTFDLIDNALKTNNINLFTQILKDINIDGLRGFCILHNADQKFKNMDKNFKGIYDASLEYLETISPFFPTNSDLPLAFINQDTDKLTKFTIYDIITKIDFYKEFKNKFTDTEVKSIEDILTSPRCIAIYNKYQEICRIKDNILKLEDDFFSYPTQTSITPYIKDLKYLEEVFKESPKKLETFINKIAETGYIDNNLAVKHSFLFHLTGIKLNPFSGKPNEIDPSKII